MSSMGPPPPDGDVNYGPGNVETIAVLCTISIVVVAMRFATRIWITKSLWWDDWTILLALLGTVIGSALDFVEVHYGFGRHQYYLTAYQLQEFQKYTYGEWIQTFATLMWLKVSICLFLLRIPTSKALIRPLQGAIAFLILSNVILTLLWILQCLPVAASWNMKISGKCFTKDQLREIILAQAIISLISDFTFSCYPILILWRVQLKPKTKIGLCILMGLGVITGSCCIVRTVLNYESIPPDVTFGGIINWYWRSFEVTVGFVAACAPACRPGYTWLRLKLFPPKASSQYPLNKGSPYEKSSAPKVSIPSKAFSAYGDDPFMDLESGRQAETQIPEGKILNAKTVDVSKEPPSPVPVSPVTDKPLPPMPPMRQNTDPYLRSMRNDVYNHMQRVDDRF